MTVIPTLTPIALVTQSGPVAAASRAIRIGALAALAAGALTLAPAAAQAAGPAFTSPSASTASAKHCPDSGGATVVRVGGLGCLAARTIIRSSLSGGRAASGYRCSSRSTGPSTTTTCRRGRAWLSYITRHAVTPEIRKEPVPPPPSPEASPRYALSITAATTTPEPAFGGEYLTVRGIVNDPQVGASIVPPFQMDYIDLYLLPAGHACLPTLTALFNEEQFGGAAIRLGGNYVKDAAAPGAVRGSGNFAIQTTSYEHTVLLEHRNVCGFLYTEGDGETPLLALTASPLPWS